ncbi:hypothetical protein MGG_16345 [Pyricularia oryzae 70-15]|uniref:Uncharacterized protein n=1 Tax=Pyricularia oryzae (strain 70-15 / ATCC MYA-4617 / FGSC 8958) TaxID=242507 RepID=G4MLA2_PYRO7|nr:uncharacterized protein MGG_16345 [Pyricularia oryzae 70-15]EHA57632.1 hypothetical protein MGG_16345 [Pyricularia oryzae 70-15]
MNLFSLAVLYISVPSTLPIQVDGSTGLRPDDADFVYYEQCSNPAPSTSSPLTRVKDNPAGYRQQPPACAVEPTLVGNFVSMATNDRQLRCLDTGPSR